jgi:Spy/CpxP family protein refolding chaperone
MNKMFAGSLIALLLVLVIGSVSLAQEKRMKKDFKERRGIEQLNLNEDQKSKIQELRLQHQKSMVDLNAELKNHQLALKEIKMKKDFSRSEYLSAVEKLNEVKNKISTSHANHRMDVYEQLDNEQREKFLMMGDRMRDKAYKKHRPMRSL